MLRYFVLISAFLISDVTEASIFQNLGFCTYGGIGWRQFIGAWKGRAYEHYLNSLNAPKLVTIAELGSVPVGAIEITELGELDYYVRTTQHQLLLTFLPGSDYTFEARSTQLNDELLRSYPRRHFRTIVLFDPVSLNLFDASIERMHADGGSTIGLLNVPLAFASPGSKIRLLTPTGDPRSHIQTDQTVLSDHYFKGAIGMFVLLVGFQRLAPIEPLFYYRIAPFVALGAAFLFHGVIYEPSFDSLEPKDRWLRRRHPAVVGFFILSGTHLAINFCGSTLAHLAHALQ